MAVLGTHKQSMADAGKIISLRNFDGPLPAAPLPVPEIGIWRTPINITSFGVTKIVPYDGDTGALLLGISGDPIELGAEYNITKVYAGGTQQVRFNGAAIASGGGAWPVTVLESDDDGLAISFRMPAGNYSVVGAHLDLKQGPIVDDPLLEEERSATVAAYRYSNLTLMNSWTEVVVGPRIGTFIRIENPFIATETWILKVFADWGTLGVGGVRQMAAIAGLQVYAQGVG